MKLRPLFNIVHDAFGIGLFIGRIENAFLVGIIIFNVGIEFGIEWPGEDLDKNGKPEWCKAEKD